MTTTPPRWCLSGVIRIFSVPHPDGGSGALTSRPSGRTVWSYPLDVRTLKLGTLDDVPDSGPFGTSIPTDSGTSRLGIGVAHILYPVYQFFVMTWNSKLQQLRQPKTYKRPGQSAKRNGQIGKTLPLRTGYRQSTLNLHPFNKLKRPSVDLPLNGSLLSV